MVTRSSADADKPARRV